MTTVLIAHSYPTMCAGLRTALSQAQRTEVVAETG